MSEPVSVGLVGAGPWATMVHAPMLAAGPETRLVGVWARRPEAAADLASRHDAVAFPSYEAMLDSCEAVAFSVPPAVQAELALTAARAGKGLLLEKPIAASLDAARRLADAVGEAGVGSIVVFTSRFSGSVRAYLATVDALDPFGGYLLNATSAFLEGPFASSPWRHEGGALLDIGPHAVDLLSAALGLVVETRARQARQWLQIDFAHRSGAISTALLSSHVPGAMRNEIELFGTRGSQRLTELRDADTFATLRREFATVVRDRAPHECDVQRGLYVQTILDEAARQVSSG